MRSRLQVIHTSTRSALPVRSRGFTLVEISILLAILGILLALAVPSYQKALDEARTAQAIGDIKALEAEILLYEIKNRVLPATLADLGRDDLDDPWGAPYVYANFALMGPGAGGKRKDRNLVPINSAFDLYSKGPDGNSVAPLTAPASEDDIIRANDGSFVGRASDY